MPSTSVHFLSAIFFFCKQEIHLMNLVYAIVMIMVEVPYQINRYAFSHISLNENQSQTSLLTNIIA